MTSHISPLSAERRAALLRSLHGTGTPPPTQTQAPSPLLAAPRRRLPAWAAVLIGLQAVALTVLALQRPDAQPTTLVPAAQAAPAPAAATAATAPPRGVQFEASGFVSATRTATVSARTMGQISEVLVDEGTRVARGQVLARLADAKARTELQLTEAQRVAAQARVATAEAQWREAERALQRDEQLRDQGFNSDATVSRSKTALDVAASTLTSSRADLQLAQLNVQRQQQLLDEHTIRAPFDGVVQARNAQVGEIVAPGGAGGGYTRTGIYTLVDMNSLELAVDVGEDRIPSVQPGQPVHVSFYALKSGEPLRGEVLRVMPAADRAKSTVQVRVRLLQTDVRVLPDMAAKVQFLAGA
jgi:HlyD family secretion protein